MLVQVVYLEVQAQLLETFLTEVTANMQASLQENGVVQFDVLQEEDNPLKYMLYEVYNALEDLEAHRQTAHFKRWLETGIPTLTGERVRVIYKKL